MKKIIEVLILIGGLMMIIACANPSSTNDDAFIPTDTSTTNDGSDTNNDNSTNEGNTTTTTTNDGSDTNNGNSTNEEPISNIINAEFNGNKTFEIVINNIHIGNGNKIKIYNTTGIVHIKSISNVHIEEWKTFNFGGLETSISGNKVTIKYTNKTDTYCSTANCYYNISEKTLYISY